MSRLDEFLHEHRVVPEDEHERGDPGRDVHDPRVRSLHAAYVRWLGTRDVTFYPPGEREFTAAVELAGYTTYADRAGTRFRGLLLPTAVEHAGGGASPEDYWPGLHAAAIAAELAEYERQRAEEERKAAEAEAASLAGEAKGWWTQVTRDGKTYNGNAYVYLIEGRPLPDHVEAARARYFDAERWDRERRDYYVSAIANDAWMSASRQWRADHHGEHASSDVNNRNAETAADHARQAWDSASKARRQTLLDHAVRLSDGSTAAFLARLGVRDRRRAA
jgi:hypothetical protein